MTDAHIFLADAERDRLIEMAAMPYDTEDVLQAFLARYKDLLPGSQINPDNPRRWLLVTREMSVPDTPGGLGRWSVDHLFLDQDGIPTIVECKRSSDTRIRREVVAQMLEYAANGLRFWSIADIQAAANAEGRDIDGDVLELLGVPEGATAEVETYWNLVSDNLRRARVRLIFVADEIPRELRRLVEYLNEKLTDTEVLALEIKQYVGGNQVAFVPRLIGRTEAAQQIKPPTAAPRSQTSRDAFLSSAESASRPVLAQLMDEAVKRGHTLYWGSSGFSVVRRGLPYSSFIRCFPDGLVEIFYRNLGLSVDQQSGLYDTARQNFKVLRESASKKTLMFQLGVDTAAVFPGIYRFVFDQLESLPHAEEGHSPTPSAP